MSPIKVSLGYVILFVRDVPAALSFYEQAFGLTRRFLHESNGYGEMETGATRLSFVNHEFAKGMFKKAPMTTTPDGAPFGIEIALVTTEVREIYARAVKAGASAWSEPEKKPWGQEVAYVRDHDGHLVEICSPIA